MELPKQNPLPKIEGGFYADALAGMVNKEFCNSEKYLEQQHRADRLGADADLLAFERKLIAKAKKVGIPLFAHSVCRGSAEQDKLFVLGNSKAKAGQSPHNYGAAVDIVHGTKAWDLTRKQWEIIGHMGKELATQYGYKLVWGGDWDFYDPAHWELRNWRDIRAKFADKIR